MRERTERDDIVAKKKHFKKGDVVEVRVFKSSKTDTGKAGPKTYTYIILDKVHSFEGEHGTYYKVWDVEQGVEADGPRYLHDIPEDVAEVCLVGEADEPRTA